MSKGRTSHVWILSLVVAIVALSAVTRSQNPATATQSEQSAVPEGPVQYATVASQALGRELRYAVQLPPSYSRDQKRRYPVLYFLHGMNGNEGEFERRGVAAAISKLRADGKIGEFITVAPAGQNSFYVNAKNGPQYEDAIVKDLVAHVEKTYRAMPGPRNRAIQGLSMGGFGAMLIAFKHPELFSSMTAHCSAVVAEIPKPTGTSRRELFLLSLIGKLFGDPPDEEYFKANNPMSLADSNAASIKKAGLKIYFDVGDQDRYGFTEPNKNLDELMTKDGLTHEFHIFPGGHGWDYML
ncbi:MAG TPA: alpha/beta hydrolase-fold protein, partial [Blastocatellia bacterium]|nr:alpha/beta hydrolase-fold protein [Blastocatellia bacterium]